MEKKKYAIINTIKNVEPLIEFQLLENKHQTVKLLTVCFCLVTYAFQSEYTLCSCLNAKELLAPSRRDI